MAHIDKLIYLETALSTQMLLKNARELQIRADLQDEFRV